MSGNRTRVNCLEGSYAHHYTNIAWIAGKCVYIYLYRVKRKNVHLLSEPHIPQLITTSWVLTSLSLTIIGSKIRGQWPFNFNFIEVQIYMLRSVYFWVRNCVSRAKRQFLNQPQIYTSQYVSFLDSKSLRQWQEGPAVLLISISICIGYPP